MSDHRGPAGHPMHESEIPSPPTASAIFSPICLALDQIDAPAFIVDKNLSLLWLAPNGQDALTRALARELEFASTRNIFNLLLRPTIKQSLSDWQAFFSFIYVTLCRTTSRDTFAMETVFIPQANLPAAADPTAPGPAIRPFQVDSCIIGGDTDPTEPPKRIFSLEFKADTLFMLRPDSWHTAATGARQNELASAPSEQPVDEKKSIGVLFARLNDSHRIADAMLPEVFFKLMNRIWDEADDIVKSLGGLRAGGNGDQIHYKFAESVGRNPIFSAICCATQINGRMRVLEEKLKAQQGWGNAICMNMGISQGHEDPTVSDPDDSMALMIPGGAFDQASQLGAIAAQGEIWITKHAVAQLPKKLLDQVVLGVDREGRFMRNFFTRLSDLSQETWAGQRTQDPGGLSLARVVKIDKRAPTHPVTIEV